MLPNGDAEGEGEGRALKRLLPAWGVVVLNKLVPGDEALVEAGWGDFLVLGVTTRSTD